MKKRARELIIDMAATPTGCHVGGSLSVVDLLIAAYERYGSDGASEIVLSKGHAAAALYAVLHLFGRLEQAPAESYGRAGSHLTGHPNPKVPGVRFSTGSLGHGVPLALGWALGQKLKGSAGVGLAIVGDGELQEGICWEAFQIAQAKRIGNFTVVVDVNGGQNDGLVSAISPQPLLADRFRAFGFKVVEIDGHDLDAIRGAFETARDLPGQPLAILAATQKGKGVPAIEGNPASHYAVIKLAVAEQWKRSMV
jgi:transketolase